MTALDPLESSLRAALEGQADEAMQQTDTTSEFTRFVAGGRGSRTPVAIGKGASVAAGLAAAVAVVAIVLVAGSVFSGPVVAHRHPSPYPPLQRVAAAVPLLPGAVTSSNRTAGTVAPELVVGRILWSVQNAGSNGSAYVLRSDARTLRVLSTVHFGTTFRHLRTTQLFRVGDTVVMPVQSVESSAGNDSRDAVLRFDAQTGKRLPQLDVRSTGVGVATPEGVFVQTDVSQLGLLDPTGNRVVRTISMPFVDEVVYSSGLLWGYDVATSHVVGIDPSNGSQQAVVPLPGTSSAVLVQAGSDGVLISLPLSSAPAAPPAGTYLLDTRSMRITAGTAFGAESPRLNSWAVDGSRLWCASGELIVEFDAHTLAVLHSYRVPASDLNATRINSVIPIAFDRLYISNSATNTIDTIDLSRVR